MLETHHQLACAPFCHATSKNGMNKKIVTIGRIFDRNLMICWLWIFRWSMEKKEKTKLSVASVSATHSYESRYRSKSRIDSWFRGWQIEIESCPLSDSIFIRRIIPEHDGFFLFFFLPFNRVFFYMFVVSDRSLISWQVDKDVTKERFFVPACTFFHTITRPESRFLNQIKLTKCSTDNEKIWTTWEFIFYDGKNWSMLKFAICLSILDARLENVKRTRTR